MVYDGIPAEDLDQYLRTWNRVLDANSLVFLERQLSQRSIGVEISVPCST
jgi:hypothetical protein